MIDAISIHNFQSLTDVSLDLAPLTVIVGPSSSGKSAFIRSLRALTGNRRGHDFITHGERVASISAHLTTSDPLRSGTVTLTRSTQTSPNSYVIIPDDPSHPLAPKAEFTKLGGDVPADVSAFLGIPTAQIPLAIASQFDKPYLLDTPASEVARILGSLTNAHVILNAARESNRQKLSNAQTLRTRSADLDAIKERIPEFQALKAQREALSRAEDLIARARQIQERITSLDALTETAIIAESRIPALQSALAAIPTLPDIDSAVSGYVQAERTLRTVSSLVTSLVQAQSAIDTHQQTLASIPDTQSIDSAAQRLADARSRLSTYQSAIKAVSDAQSAVRASTATLTEATDAHTSALADVQSAMQGISAGFETYFREHGDPIEERIHIRDAATLAARYLAQLDS